MDWETIAMVLAGALVGGFVNGLTSFGTGLASLPFLLQVLEPALAAQIVAVASVAGQLTAARELLPHVAWRRIWPLITAGLFGLPVGVALLPHLNVAAFKLIVGIVLIAYCAVMLWAAGRIRIGEGGQPRSVLVGFLSGILGGIAGLSGVLVTVWAALEAWPKDRRRITFHGFNLVILAVMLLVQAGMGQMTAAIVPMSLLALPATMLGVMAGARLNRRLDDRRFDRVVLGLLLLGGLGLVIRSL